MLLGASGYAKSLKCLDVFNDHPSKKLEVDLGLPSGLLSGHESVKTGLQFLVRSAFRDIELHNRNLRVLRFMDFESLTPDNMSPSMRDAIDAVLTVRALDEWARNYYADIFKESDSLREFTDWSRYDQPTEAEVEIARRLEQDIDEVYAGLGPIKLRNWDASNRLLELKVAEHTEIGGRWETYYDSIAHRVAVRINRTMKYIESYRRVSYNRNFFQQESKGIAGWVKVRTPQGLRPINVLREGDEVLSLDRTTGEVVISTVAESWTFLASSVHLEVGSKRLPISVGIRQPIFMEAYFNAQRGLQFGYDLVAENPVVNAIGYPSSNKGFAEPTFLEVRRDIYPEVELETRLFQLALNGENRNFFIEDVLVPAANAPEISNVGNTWETGD